jgi:mono/diheme cytochrome c family protein
MNSLFDILLGRPLPMEMLRGLLFATFALHMVFVLFTIGTAILLVVYYLRFRFDGDDEAGAWVQHATDVFLAHKSLAVVLGVAPLLLIQVAFTIPFFTAVNLFAPYWLAIIACLILAFLALDYVGRNFRERPWLRSALAIGGLAILLIIPGVFVAVLTGAENSGQWITIMRNGYRLSGVLAWHWLARYAHVLAAGIVFAGLFFAVLTARGEAERRRSLLKWVVAGIVVQAAIGLALYLSLPGGREPLAETILAAGILCALALLVLLWRERSGGRPLRVPVVAPLALILLLAMLLTRQSLQDRGVLPLNDQITANAVTYQAAMQQHRPAALTTYENTLNTPYDNVHNAYTLSCGFCHGAAAAGNGIEAKNLAVPPEVVSAVRTTRPYLRDRLTRGVNGSAMPYFTVYTGDRLDGLMDYLDAQWGVFEQPAPVDKTVSAAAQEQAKTTFANTCATCHGPDGGGNAVTAKGLQPPPPDFRQFSLTPDRTFQVITNGYPGTAMVGNGALPEEVRWGLAKYVSALRQY